LAKAEAEPLASEDALLLDEQELTDLRSHLFPDPRTVAEDDKTLRWVHPNFVESRRPITTNPVKASFQAINELLRDTILFLKPSYILNAVGNAAMLPIQQGWLTGPNVLRAMRGNALYGAENARILDGLAGESRSLSYVPDRGVRALSSKMAQGWNIV